MLITIIARTQNHRSGNITNHAAIASTTEGHTLCGLAPGIDDHSESFEVAPFIPHDEDAVLALFRGAWQLHCRRCLRLLRREIGGRAPTPAQSAP